MSVVSASSNRSKISHVVEWATQRAARTDEVEWSCITLTDDWDVDMSPFHDLHIYINAYV